MNTAGQVKLTVGYSIEESRLFITVHSCRSLFMTYFTSLSCHIFDPENSVPTHVVNVIAIRPTEPWRPAPRTVQTLMFPSSCCLTRRLPPRGEPPPRRETSTQNSMRGKTNKWGTRDSGGRARVLTDLSLRSLSFCRFDFDFSLEESIQRRLDLSVKNSVSFMSRERELIGKVRIYHQSRLKCGQLSPKTSHKFLGDHLLLFLVALSCSWTWTKLTSKLVSHNGNNLNKYWTIMCNNMFYVQIWLPSSLFKQ